MRAFLGVVVGLLLGTLFGSLAAAIALAGFGALVGHLYDRRQAPLDLEMEWKPADRAPPAAAALDEAERPLLRPLCQLFVLAAISDGPMSREEVRAIRAHFEQELGYSGKPLQFVRIQLKVALEQSLELSETVAALRPHLPQGEEEALLDGLYRVALADGDLSRLERDFLRRSAELLGLSAEQHSRVAGKHFSSDDLPYRVLGLSPTCSDGEVKSAFRRMAREHHPDRAAHLGPRAQEEANRQFVELREAYEEIRRRRGMS